MSPPLRHVLAMTGASGTVFGRRLLQRLVGAERVGELHLIVSDAARRVALEELGCRASGARELAEGWLAGCERRAELFVHPVRDVGAPPASGSFRHDGMVICPCSTATAAAIARGTTTNLVHRAAECSLKERRRLILMIRESPLSLIHLDTLATAARAGATVMPLSPPWYHRPETLEQLVDHQVDRALDHLGLPELVGSRWTGGGGAGDAGR